MQVTFHKKAAIKFTHSVKQRNKKINEITKPKL